MSLLSCTDVAVEYADRVVFSGLDLKLEPGDRLGVVGSNGEGKSSLLSLLSGVQQPSTGRVDRQGRLLVAHLPQESPEPVAETVLGEAMASRTDLARLRDELGHLEHQLTIPGPDSEAQLTRYGEAQSAYEGLGGYDLEARARAVLGGLGLGDEEQARSPHELSVGQVRRMELSKLLLQEADLLLLDEPTTWTWPRSSGSRHTSFKAPPPSAWSPTTGVCWSGFAPGSSSWPQGAPRSTRVATPATCVSARNGGSGGAEPGKRSRPTSTTRRTTSAVTRRVSAPGRRGVDRPCWTGWSGSLNRPS